MDDLAAGYSSSSLHVCNSRTRYPESAKQTAKPLRLSTVTPHEYKIRVTKPATNEMSFLIVLLNSYLS